MTILGVLVFIGVTWVMLFVYSKTARQDHPKIANFNDDLYVIAHRGGSLEAPENTISAFENAYKTNPDVLFEFDIRLTKDNKIVVLHDETLDRTTNGTGKVTDYTHDELSKFDAGYNFQNENGEFSHRNKNVKIPLLEEVFQRFPNTRMIVELKPYSRDLVDQLYELIKKYDRIDKTIIGSQNTRNILYFRSLNPDVLTAASPDEMHRSLMLARLFLEGLDKMTPQFFCIPEKHNNIEVLNKRLFIEAQKRNKKFFIWTINEKDDMIRLKNFGVNGIITDRPKLLYELLQQ